MCGIRSHGSHKRSESRDLTLPSAARHAAWTAATSGRRASSSWGPPSRTSATPFGRPARGHFGVLGTRQRLSRVLGGFQLRAALLKGAAWFVAADVCRALGPSMKSGSAEPHTRALSSAERYVSRRSDTPEIFSGIVNQVQSISLISEAGLYKLVLRAERSNPVAAKFQVG